MLDYDCLKDFFLKELSVDISKLNGNIKVFKNIDLEVLKPYVGCFKKTDNNIITNYQLVVPDITDIKTLLVNIHEYTHAIQCEMPIDMEDINDQFVKTIPITMERLYIIKYNLAYLGQFNKHQLLKLEHYLTDTNKYYKGIIAYYYQFVLINLYLNKMDMLLNHKFSPQIDLDLIKEKTLELLKNNTR